MVSEVSKTNMKTGKNRIPTSLDAFVDQFDSLLGRKGPGGAAVWQEDV